MIKNIIVTGGNGQDAKILAKIIKSYNIYFITKKIIKKKIRHLNYQNINLHNFKKTSELIDKINPSGIIHLASKNETAHNKKLKFKDHYFNNYQITKNLLNSVAIYSKKTKFIFAGSSQMYGRKSGVVTEKSKFKPNCHYSKYKVDSYNLIKSYKKKFNLNASTLILFNHDSKYRNKNFLLPRIVHYLKKKNLSKLSDIYNENINGDFSHAEDICNAIYKILNLKNLPDRIILSSFKLTSINDLINYGLKKFKINNFPKSKVNKPKKLLIGNNTFAKKKLNWKIKKNSLIAFKEILKNF